MVDGCAIRADFSVLQLSVIQYLVLAVSDKKLGVNFSFSLPVHIAEGCLSITFASNLKSIVLHILPPTTTVSCDTTSI